MSIGYSLRTGGQPSRIEEIRHFVRQGAVNLCNSLHQKFVDAHLLNFKFEAERFLSTKIIQIQGCGEKVDKVQDLALSNGMTEWTQGST